MANAKSLSYAKSGEERIEHVGRVGRANNLAQSLGRRADAICEQNKVGGEWGSGGEERPRFNQGRRAAAEPAFRLAWFGGPALEFRGNCAAERVKPLACLGADFDGQ